jgi:hypothetical protein
MIVINPLLNSTDGSIYCETCRPLYLDSGGKIIDPWVPLFFVSFIIIVGQFPSASEARDSARARRGTLPEPDKPLKLGMHRLR